MRLALIILLVIAAVGPVSAQSLGAATNHPLHLPKLGWVSNLGIWRAGAVECPSLGVWNKRQDIFTQEEKDMSNSIRFRKTDPARAFNYWAAVKRDSDRMQAILRELCWAVPPNTAVLVLKSMRDDTNNTVFLVKSVDGRVGIMARGSILFH